MWEITKTYHVISFGAPHVVEQQISPVHGVADGLAVVDAVIEVETVTEAEIDVENVGENETDGETELVTLVLAGKQML